MPDSDERERIQIPAKRLEEHAARNFLKAGEHGRTGLRHQDHENRELQAADEVVRGGELTLAARLQ
jgi:hypothetical protein